MSINVSIIIMAVLIIGAAAFIVSVITQMTKNLGFLKRIPTDLEVIILSLVICLLGYFAYASYAGLAIIWYYVAGTIIGSFIVALVARDGWTTVAPLFRRFVNASTAKDIASNINVTDANGSGSKNAATDTNEGGDSNENK